MFPSSEFPQYFQWQICSFSRIHLSVPREGKLQNYCSSRPFSDLSSHLSLILTTHPRQALEDPSIRPVWLLPSSLLQRVPLRPPSQPDFKVRHWTHSPARTLHAVTPCPSFLSLRQSPTCVNPITCCPHSWSKIAQQDRSVPLVWWSLPLVGGVAAIPSHATAQASCFPLAVMHTPPLCSVLYSKLNPCSKLIPSPASSFPHQAQTKSLFKSDLLLKNAFVKNKE